MVTVMLGYGPLHFQVLLLLVTTLTREFLLGMVAAHRTSATVSPTGLDKEDLSNPFVLNFSHRISPTIALALLCVVT
jgi:hypothetical protein